MNILILLYFLTIIYQITISFGFLFSDLNDLSSVINKKEKPKIIIAPQNASILANHQAFFICIPEGNPKPKVIWMFNNKSHLPERYNVIRDSVLQLTSARSEDNGAIISCVCRNVMGSDEKFAFIRVYNDINFVPKAFPRYLGKSSIIVSQKNSNVTLECLVVGQQHINIIWFKNYYPLDLRNTRYQLISGRNLFIMRAVESDTGKYHCMAINEYGSTISPAKSLMIRVSRYSPHFVYVSPDQFIRTGSSVSLKCTGEGSPTPTVYWVCGNTKLTGHNTGSDIIQPEYGSIEMTLSDISESLNCTCVAKTNKEMANHTVHITVKNLPVAPKIVRISSISYRSCLLTWKYQSSLNIPISSFSVFYIPTNLLRIDQPFSKIIDISSKEIQGADFEINTKITDLKPFTNYSLWLVTNGGEGVSDPSRIHSFKTLESEPTSSPLLISISLVGETSVRIKWKPPIEANGEITQYNIYYSKKKDAPLSQWSINGFPLTSGNQNSEYSMDIHMLEKNTVYYFGINCRNNAGEGPMSEITEKFVNDEEIYQLQNLTILTVTSKTVDISWKINPVSNVSLFKIVCTPHGPRNLQKEKTYKVYINKINTQSLYFATITNLTSNTLFTVGISPLVDNIVKYFTKIKFKTSLSDEKEAIKAKSISQDSIVVSVARESTVASLKTIIEYYPYGSVNKSLKKSCFLQPDNFCQLTDLMPETLYQLNIKYNGIIMKRFTETWPSAPEPIQDLHLQVLFHRSLPFIRASWKYKTTQFPVFEVSYRPLNIPNIFKNGKYSNKVNVSGLQFESDPKSHVMGSTVEFSVRAMIAFQASESVHARITLPEGIPRGYPSKLISLKSLKENFVSLIWNPLPWNALNGKFKANEVSCYKNSDLKQIFIKNVSTNEIHIPKSILMPKAQCQIRSRTKVGPGPWSPFIFINYNQTNIEPPTNINAIRTSRCCLKITWKWRKEFSDFYSHFLIIIVAEGKEHPEKLELRTKYPSSLYNTNLLDVNHSNYSISIYSVSKDGNLSTASEKVLARPLSNHWPVVNVNSVICLPITSRKIKLKWNYHYKFDNLSHFRINFTGITQFVSNMGNEITMIREEREDSSIFEIPFVEYEKEIQDILPNTQYNIDIEPIQLPLSYIWSEPRSVTCSTTSEPPRDVTELKIGQVDRENSVIHLVVSQPSFEYGPISIYFIIIDANYLITRAASPHNISEKEPDLRSRDLTLNFLAKANRSNLSKKQSLYIAAEINATLVMKQSLHGKVFMFPLGNRKTESIFPLNKPLEKRINYRAALVACISTNFNEISIKNVCSVSKWSDVLNPLTSVPYVVNGQQKNKSVNLTNGTNNSSVTVLSGIILTSIFIPIVICIFFILSALLLKRRNGNMKLFIPCLKLRNTSQNYYPPSNNEIKENLVNPLIVSTNAGSSYSNQNHDSLELKRYQISTTPDLLVQSSPSTSFKETKVNTNEKNFKHLHHKVPIGLLQEYISNLKLNDNRGFSMEFESIDHANQFSWEQSNKPANKTKNRYANVVAYDHSRVVLQNTKILNDVADSLDSYRSNDYINANYINGYRKQNAYIATQGPLAETLGDFWRMIWEQRSVIIVMVTLLIERSRVKCEQYWPKGNRGNQFTYGGIIVTLKTIQELAYFVCRSFIVQKIGSSEKREIKQFQFLAWPDHGVPQCTIPFLMFINRIKKEEPLDSGPVVVHCSAGVGRTGVFIAVDAMLEQMKHEKSVDIYSYITHIRSQRNYMVQTEEQYIFIHDVLLDYFQSVNTEITSQQLFSHVEKLSKVEYEKAGLLQFTGFQLEYRRLLRWSSLFSHITPSSKSECSTKSSDSIGYQPDFSITNCETASLMINQCKNRSPYSLPPDINRVTLCPIRGVEGSDYINASWIDGFKCRKAYIATQCPIKETTEDFWRMLWEHDCGLVITLNYVSECTQYWPKDRSARYQFFVVDPILEYQMSHFIMREFKLTDARDGQSRVLRQFQFTNWIEDSCIPVSIEQLLELIDQIQKTKEQFGQNGPLTVHCNTGSTRTGIFLVLSILVEKLKTDNSVNIFETFKLLKWQRPSLIESEDQYQFCFAALLEYLTLYSDENTNL